MRTTLRIDDDLLRELKERANREGISLVQIVNRTLRQGVQGLRQSNKQAQPYREKTFAMGQCDYNLDKALALAASLEDAEIAQELDRRK